MRIGIIGAGNIGGNIARFLAAAGHDVSVSGSRDRATLEHRRSRLRADRHWRHRRRFGDGGPRRSGAVYGEEYREVDARAVVDAVRAGTPIPPAPTYDAE